MSIWWLVLVLVLALALVPMERFYYRPLFGMGLNRSVLTHHSRSSNP